MIRSGSDLHSLCQLLIGKFVFALRAQARRQDWTNAIHLRVTLEHIFQDSSSRINLASILQHARLERLNQRVIRLQRRALIDFVQRFFV